MPGDIEIIFDANRPELKKHIASYGPAPSKDAVALESFRVQGLMNFPQDHEAAKTFAELCFDDWANNGRPEGLFQESTIVRIISKSVRAKFSKGICAAFVGWELIRMESQGVPVSLNKACYLTSERNLRIGKVEVCKGDFQRSYALLTDVKSIASNFRLYRNVVHFWIAGIADQRKLIATDSFQRVRVELGFAQTMRQNLLWNKSIDAETWNMSECSPEAKVIGSGWSHSHSMENVSLLKTYRNPNLGWG